MPARTDHRRLFALAMLVPLAALAQPPTWPTADDIARERAAHPFPIQEGHQESTVGLPPHIASAPSAPHPLDLSALARDGATLAAPACNTTTSGALRIFITLDIPKASLERLVDGASRTGATIVLRGLKSNSMRATLDAVRPLLEAHPVAWVIDPESFERYQVAVAPSFVLAAAENPSNGIDGSCNRHPTSEGYLQVSGDVSVDYALEEMARQRPMAASRIAPLLARLHGP